MNAKLMIAVVAFVVALTGCLAMATETSGADGDTSIVVYHFGADTEEVEVDPSSFAPVSPETLGFTVPEGKVFEGWCKFEDSKDKSVFPANVSMAFSSLENNNTMDLYAVLADVEGPSTETQDPTTISYIVGTTTYTKEHKDPVILASLADLGITAPAGQTFMGWYDAKSLPAGSTEPTQTYASGSIYTGAVKEFTAYFETDTYTVQFMDSDGSIIQIIDPDDPDGEKVDKITVAYNTEVSVPTIEDDETRNDGMVFTGWNLNGEPAVVKDGKVTITGNSVFVATYEKDITVTFVVDGITTYTHVMTGITYPTDPVKDSFTFVGWDLNGTVVLKAGCTEDDLRALGLDADTTFTAVFEPAIYTVSFVVDGDVVATQTVKHGDMATEPAFIPALEGMDFVKWDFDFTQAITGDTTIEAVFEPTPEPEPTGLSNPTVQIMAIVIGVLVIFIVAVLVWKKDDVRVIIVKKLDKSKKSEEPKQ